MALVKGRTKKVLFIILGTLCVVLGVIGIVLPILPTTPFLLLASYLYFRSSLRFYNFLINHKVLGFYIKSYIEKKGIPVKVKVINLVLLWTVISISAFVAIDNNYIRILLYVIAVGVTIHILMLKTLKEKR